MLLTEKPIHLWVRAETRLNEERVGLTPNGAKTLLNAGFHVTVERSSQRALPIDGYTAVGCSIAAEGTWTNAPDETVIFGLKELPDDGTPLRHKHIMFGHAYKGQASGRVLLDRFQAGGGTLYDLEYLVGEDGRRVAAFGYWAGYAGAAVSILAYAAQQKGALIGPISTFTHALKMVDYIRTKLNGTIPTVLIIGALGRVGTGAADLCAAVGLNVTKWDMAETASGGPFPQVLEHDVFLNCILACDGTPIFVPELATTAPRKLRVIGDIACDPQSDFSPIKVYKSETTWEAPVLRVHDDPPLDVMAIDNLPSLLPTESSGSFADQLLLHLSTLNQLDAGVWRRAKQTFNEAL